MRAKRILGSERMEGPMQLLDAADSGDHSAARWHSHERAHLLEIFRFEFKSKLVRVSLTVYPHH